MRQFGFKSSLVVLAVWFCGGARQAVAQPVTLADETVVHAFVGDPDEAVAEMPGLVRLTPDGNNLLFIDPPRASAHHEPAQLVIVSVASLAEGKPRVVFRPELGRSTAGELYRLLLQNLFSPDGTLFVSPDFSAPDPRTGVARRPVLVCQLATGNVARTRFAADLQYAAIDHTGKLLLDMDGQAHALVTGQPARQFGYRGLVRAANPVAPLVCADTGVEGKPGPRQVNVWNLRDNKLLARVPHNEKFTYSAYVEPAWTSDGTYLYFGDAVGERFPDESVPIDEIKMVTRVWNIKTGQLVGNALPWTRWRRPGPRAGTMILSTQFTGPDEGRQFLHDAVSGATAELPVPVLDAGGGTIAYVKQINNKPHLCVAKLHWNVGPAKDETIRKRATKPVANTTLPATKPPRRVP